LQDCSVIMSEVRDTDAVETLSDVDVCYTVFEGSSQEDVAYAKVFWSSLCLQPPIESSLVSLDIRQRLKVAKAPQSRAGKMDKRKDLNEFDKGQIVMSSGPDQSISKTAALVGCSRSAVVSIYQKWSKEGTVVNRRQGHGRTRLIDVRGEQRLTRVIRSNRRATVAQIAEEVNAGSDRKVSEYTVHDGDNVRKQPPWATENEEVLQKAYQLQMQDEKQRYLEM
ncbi:hypothetical protein QTP86_021934, partial [Hemibagrus guttatus]